MDNKIVIEKDEALKLMLKEDTIVIDCRTPEELEEVPPIVEDYYNIPFDDEFVKNVGEEEEEIPKDNVIVIYCSHGARSLKAAQLLKVAGYDEVYSLNGGIEAVYNNEESSGKKVGTFYE